MAFNQSSKINPTFFGYVANTKDALILIQAALNNTLPSVPRRPHDRERSDLIQSGNIFVFSEEKSGIKRWTDGVAWSPSRILGRFLVYRELDRNATNDKKKGKGDKRKSGKKRKREDEDEGGLNDYSPSGAAGVFPNTGNHLNPIANGSIGASSNIIQQQQPGQYPPIGQYNRASTTSTPNRALVGSLVTSYAFRERGLVKKTLSITVSTPEEETIHLVSYYAAEDVQSNRLARPSDSEGLKNMKLNADLWNAVKESGLGSKSSTSEDPLYDEFSGNQYEYQVQYRGIPGQPIIGQPLHGIPIPQQIPQQLPQQLGQQQLANYSNNGKFAYPISYPHPYNGMPQQLVHSGYGHQDVAYGMPYGNQQPPTATANIKTESSGVYYSPSNPASIPQLGKSQTYQPQQSQPQQVQQQSQQSQPQQAQQSQVPPAQTPTQPQSHTPLTQTQTPNQQQRQSSIVDGPRPGFMPFSDSNQNYSTSTRSTSTYGSVPMGGASFGQQQHPTTVQQSAPGQQYATNNYNGYPDESANYQSFQMPAGQYKSGNAH